MVETGLCGLGAQLRASLLALIAGCAGGVDTGDPLSSPPAEPHIFVPLDTPRLLRRIRLDLHGLLPEPDDLDAVEADPTQLDEIRDRYLQDPRLEEHLVSVFSERWGTRMDQFELEYFDFHLEPPQEYEFESSIGEEPLRLMAHIATRDLPWTEIVTADYTMANEMLAEIWPIDYPEDGEGWEVSHYTDARPAVGVLVSNGLWWRYVTNISNQNRSRAAIISSLFLCEDLLSRPVSLAGAVALSDEDGTAKAIQSEPSCIACHSTIEPLASALFGFWTVISYNPLEMSQYHAEREMLGETYLGFSPGYYGQPLQGLVDLGPAVAADPRFSRCAVRGAATDMLRRPVEIRDFSTVDSLHDDFVDGGMRYSQLLRSLTELDEYRAGALTQAASSEQLERVRTERLIVAHQMSALIEDLTGFVWTWEGFEQMDNDLPGYRVLAGGVDGVAVSKPQQDPGITWYLAWTRLTQAAASHVVSEELESGQGGPFFGSLSLESRPEDNEFRAALEGIYWRLMAHRMQEEQRLELEELWTAIESLEGPAVAWASLVSVLFRDPEFVGY